MALICQPQRSGPGKRQRVEQMQRANPSRELETAQEAGGRDQTVRGADCLRSAQAATSTVPTGNVAPTGLARSSTAVNWVSPLCPMSCGIRTVRDGDGTAGRGGRKKRRRSCNEADRGVERERHHPAAKAGRLPSGLSSRESLENRHRRLSK